MAFPDFPPSRNNDPFAPQQPDQYRFTRDELRVLKECNQESFYRRCVPLMTALGLGAYYGVHLGYLKPHPKYSAAPKVIIGIITGFVGGKLSYKNECEEKILRLPGGKLKESVLERRMKTDGLISKLTDMNSYSDGSLTYAMPYVSNTFQPDEGRSIAELDTDRPLDSLDDMYKYKSDDDVEHLPPLPTQAHNMSYEELRKKNRDDFDSNRKRYRSGPLDDFTPYTPPAGSFAPPPASSREDIRFSNQPISMRTTSDPDTRQSYSTQVKVAPQRKNLYGDVLEK